MLGWNPASFWAATPHELWAAYDGWAEAHGLRRRPAALSAEEIARLEALKRRFPDQPGARQRRVQASEA